MAEDLIGGLNDPSPQVRCRAIDALGKQGIIDAVDPLKTFIYTTSDHKEKSLVIAALSEIGIHMLRPLSAMLKTATEAPPNGDDVRKDAINVMARIYEIVQSILRVLESVIADENEHLKVRETAEWALETLTRSRR